MCGMRANQSRAIGEFFGEKWPLYQRAIRSNVLCHDEMFAILDRLLLERPIKRPFHFGDFGCGDGSAAVNILKHKPVAHYTGVDASSDLITAAGNTLASLNCQKTLICRDMLEAISDHAEPFDVIVCSYSLHHLLQTQKSEFIQQCHLRLNTPGYLVLIDGVAAQNETRGEWLERLNKRFYEKVPDMSVDEIAQIMEHPEKYDYPESIATFRRFAQNSAWRSFDVLLYKDDFLAFMVYVK